MYTLEGKLKSNPDWITIYTNGIVTYFDSLEEITHYLQEFQLRFPNNDYRINEVIENG